MKLKDLVARCDKSAPGHVDFVKLYEELFGSYPNCWYDHDDQEAGRLQAFYLGRHYCTDTGVGIQVYYLDGQPVCVSQQNARKSPEVFQWISEERAQQVKECLERLFKDHGKPVNLWNPDEEMGPGYQIDYSDQFLDKEVLLHGEEPVEIIEQPRTTPDGQYNLDTIKVRDKEGKERVVDACVCIVPWKVVEEE